MKTLFALITVGICFASCKKSDHECTCTTTTFNLVTQPFVETPYPYDSILGWKENKKETHEILHETKRKAEKHCKAKERGDHSEPIRCKIE